jgi:deoxyribonuclease V
MLACVDVAYHQTHAIAACVLFRHWADPTPYAQHTVPIPSFAAYEPGAFYRRELPGVERVLAQVTFTLEVVVVDGYVWLGPDQPGLGAHLYEVLGRRSAVIGVAKTAYRDNTAAIPIMRPGTKRPLFVTSVGIELHVPAAHVSAMHGEHRIPTLLGLVDRLSRGTKNLP